jgi:nucleotide-binding universal stress UspA family protein
MNRDASSPDRPVPARARDEVGKQNKAPARIVVAVDGSPSSIDALRWAADQAARTGAAVEAVTCWSYPTSNGMEISVLDGDWGENARNTLVAALAEAHCAKVPEVIQTVTQGRAAEVLIAASAGAELLVVGSRGHGSMAGALLGSVSQRVAAHAHCPVVIIRHEFAHDADPGSQGVADPASVTPATT